MKTNSSQPTRQCYDVEQEKTNLREAALKLNLRIPEKFYDAIAEGDIVEIYQFPQNVQTYSNSEFRRICSYTDEQMKTIPFPKLFWRSDDDHKRLMSRAKVVAINLDEAVLWNVGKHELVESLHPRKRTFEMEMRWITPCFDLTTGARSAWASTLQVTLIFEWDEDLSS